MRKAMGLWMAVLLGLAGCGRGATVQEKICRNLNTMGSAITTIHKLTPTSSLNDLKRANQSMTDSVTAIKQEATGLRLTGVDNLERAQTTLTDKIASLPGTTTITSAMTAIGPALATVERAQNALSKGLSCPVPAGTSR